MENIALANDEKIIIEFQPPERAAFYCFVKYNPLRWKILLIFTICVVCGLFYNLFQANAENFFGNKPARPIAEITEPKIIYTKSTTGDVTNYRMVYPAFKYNYSDGFTIQLNQYNFIPVLFSLFGIKFSIFLLFLIGICIYRKIRQYRLFMKLIQYKITNKRIIMQKDFGRKIIQTTYFDWKQEGFIRQSYLHLLTNTYYFGMKDKTGQKNLFTRPKPKDESIIDMLSLEQANLILRWYEENQTTTNKH